MSIFYLYMLSRNIKLVKGVFCVIVLLISPLLHAKTPGHTMDFPSEYVTVNGVNLHVIESGEGQAMLFLHGYPFFGAGWQPLLKRFKSTHHVIAPDNRGYAYSDKPHGVNQYHISKLVDDVLGLINTYSKDRKVILVGHDWGGTLAWTVAQVYPGHIEKVIAINAPPLNVLLKSLATIPEQQKASSYMEILKSDRVEEHFSKLGPEILWRYGFDKMQDRGYINQDYKDAFFDAWRQPGTIRAALNWYRANLPAINDIKDEIYWPDKNARVTIPSLLITSENEKVFVPETFALISEYVDNLAIEAIPNAGHTPYFEQPDEVEAAIRAFIEPQPR